MTTTKTICDSLTKNGVYFWDADFSNRTIVLSDSLRYMFGFQQEVITFVELGNLMPEDFRATFVSTINSASEWFLPVYCYEGLIWFDIHKLQQTNDVFGSIHYIGTARQMTDAEVGEKVASKGIAVDTMSPLIKSLHYMSDSESFHQGAHLLLLTLQRQMIGVKVGITRWDNDRIFSIVDFVGGHLINARGEIIGTGGEIHSRWMQSAAMNCERSSFDVQNKIAEQWGNEMQFFVRNGGKSAIISPIVLEQGKTWGMLCVMSSTRTVWSAFDKQWLDMAAGWLGLCLKRMNLINERDNQLSLVSQACQVGGLTTWSWNCVTDERTGTRYSSSGAEVDTYDSLSVRNEIHKNDFARFQKALFALRDGLVDVMHIKVRIRNPLTDRREWCDVRGCVAERDKDGHTLVISGVSRNIESEVQRELQDKASAEFQNTIYNNMPAAIEFFNAQGELVNINCTALEMFGIQYKRSVLGVNIYDNPNLTDEMKDAIGTSDNVVFTLEYDFNNLGSYYNTKRTDKMPVVYRMSKLYTKNVLSGYMVVITDNTEILQKTRQIDIFQQYFLEIGSFAKIGVCWFTDTKNGYVSEQFNINLGIAPDAPYMRNLSLCIRVNQEDLDTYGSLLGRIFTGDIDSFQTELRVTHHDGMLHYIRVQFLRSADVVTGISIDITQAKENEKMLITARSKAERADMLKSQFLANMSHEIRTPLNAIVGFSQLIIEGANNPEMHQYFEIIQTNNDLLLSIINDIIDLSRIESGTMEMSFAENDINALGQEVFELYDKKAHKKVDFFYSPCRSTIKSYSDAIHIKQIVGNLISNAFKFTSSGRVHFWIEQANGEIVFNVTDTGCGIPVEQQERIFEPYVKLDNFSVGTGLGLSLCKNLAEAMHGKMEVISQLGRGSHFVFRLPYIHPEEAQHYMESRSHNIMLLSNNSETTQFVQYALDSYDLILEQDHVFMSLWLEKKPKLTIIDQQLFGDSISDVVSSLRSYGMEHKIIVICPSGGNVDVATIENAGAAAVILLPVTSEKFTSVVDSHVKTYEAKVS